MENTMIIDFSKKINNLPVQFIPITSGPHMVRRHLLLWSVAVFLLGCQPPDTLGPNDPGVWGCMAQVDIVNGNSISGELLAVTDSSILLGVSDIPPVADPWSVKQGTRIVFWNDVDVVWIQDRSKTLTNATNGLVSGLAVGAALGAVLISTSGDEGGWTRDEWKKLRNVSIGGAVVGLGGFLGYSLFVPEERNISFLGEDAIPEDIEPYARYHRWSK